MSAHRELFPESKVLYQVESASLEIVIQRLEKKIEDSVQKLKVETIEAPMTRKDTARYLKCDPVSVDRNWQHLKHMTEHGTPYWLASEILNYIRNK